jgi:hypothetical protein
MGIQEQCSVTGRDENRNLEEAHNVHGFLSQGPDPHPGRAAESWHSLRGSTKGLNPLRTFFNHKCTTVGTLAMGDGF